MTRAFDLGAHGYLTKASLLPELVPDLMTMAAGRPFLGSAIGLALLSRYHTSGSLVVGDFFL